jgi:hypothetical protein
VRHARPILLVPILLGLALLASACGRPAARDLPANPRPPADLLISVLVLADDGSDPQPGLFVIEPGGQLRAATGAGAARDALPPRTRQLSDTQVNQVYGTIVRNGLALDGPATRGPSAAPPRPRIEVTVIANGARRRGIHPIDDADARELVAMCRRLARIDAESRVGG